MQHLQPVVNVGCCCKKGETLILDFSSPFQVSKKIGKAVTARQLDDLMLELGPEVLRCRGIWRTSFHPNSMPIVIVNRSYYARSLRGNGEIREEILRCNCRSVEGGESKSRYFTSQAYNAGRHASCQSEHKASCQLWTPPSAGHLHSWRRGFS